jgi:hypothetical protein
MKAKILLVAGLLCIATSAHAQGPVYGKPMYDPASKSYFELVKVPRELAPGTYVPSLPFDKAMVAASGRSFKGTKGRLAVIKSYETHMFIMEHFRPNEEAWIGLRYFCKTRQLRWVSGDLLAQGQFNAWHSQWDQAQNASCVRGTGEADWMPVAYAPVAQGFRWIAKGAKKLYVAFLVEYPTGKE